MSPPVKDASQIRSKSRVRTRSRSSMAAKSEKSNDGPRYAQAQRPTNQDTFNNFKNSFEKRLETDEEFNQEVQEGMSPRSILKRARDKTVRELSESLNASKAKSPAQRSNRL